ncbi:hypothetical protein BYT27DRAFT_7196475 [Phlegmacium glaucopus]|nr:hypothetical protein BYT27DRAFT_7196475 [Phlegmacium glaucopus]
MEGHPSYPILSNLLAKYPQSASSLFQAYNDIVYGQQWTEVEVLDLESCTRATISGKKKNTDKILYIVPCSLSETLSFSWLQNVFAELFPSPNPTSSSSENIDPAPSFIYIAITSQDASIVYYKLSQGIVKPPV